MKNLTITMAVSLAFSYGSTYAQPQAGLDPDTATLVEDSNTFALDLYRELAEQEGNLFFSPYSISTAVAMAYAGARGETEKQIAETLHFTGEQTRLHPAWAKLKNEIQGNSETERKYQLYTANRLWGQKDYGFLPEYLHTTEKYYGAGLQELDFSDIEAREHARQTINAWFEEQTQDKIKKMIKPGILTEKTRLVLTNAIYFKAAWRVPFSPEHTKDGDFTLATGKKVKAKLMHGSNRTNYYKGEDFEALEIPYEEHELSMIVLLPNKADGLPGFEDRLTAANLSQWLAKLSDHRVDTTLTKFTLTSEFMLKEVLSKMGMPIAFDWRKADFSGMTKHRNKLYISHVVHKAFVDVNETGTEAAASTAEIMNLVSIPPKATFHADHPFVYLIRDNRTGTILFLGRVTDPS